MKRSDWEKLISNGNGTRIGSTNVFGYPVYAIGDDMGYHKNILTLPAYVCEITDEDMPEVNHLGIEKITYPMYICIPKKLVYYKEGMKALDTQILALITLDSHQRCICAAYDDTLRSIEKWISPYTKYQFTSLDYMLNKYLVWLNEKDDDVLETSVM